MLHCLLYVVKTEEKSGWSSSPTVHYNDSYCFQYTVSYTSVNYQSTSFAKRKDWERITLFAGLEKMCCRRLFWNSCYCVPHASSIQRGRLEMSVQKWNKMEDCTFSAWLFPLLWSFHVHFLFSSGRTQQNANSPFADHEAYSNTKQQYFEREN